MNNNNPPLLASAVCQLASTNHKHNTRIYVERWSIPLNWYIEKNWKRPSTWTLPCNHAGRPEHEKYRSDTTKICFYKPKSELETITMICYEQLIHRRYLFYHRSHSETKKEATLRAIWSGGNPASLMKCSEGRSKSTVTNNSHSIFQISRTSTSSQAPWPIRDICTLITICGILPIYEVRVVNPILTCVVVGTSVPRVRVRLSILPYFQTRMKHEPVVRIRKTIYRVWVRGPPITRHLVRVKY